MDFQHLSELYESLKHSFTTVRIRADKHNDMVATGWNRPLTRKPCQHTQIGRAEGVFFHDFRYSSLTYCTHCDAILKLER